MLEFIERFLGFVAFSSFRLKISLAIKDVTLIRLDYEKTFAKFCPR